MMFGRKTGLRLTLLGVALGMAVGGAGCGRRKPSDVNDITPSFSVNRARAPLGSAIEVTYTWTVGPQAKKLTHNYRAFVHFLDTHKVQLFTDDHVPTPAPSEWEAGKTYSYTRTVFVPIYPYVGDVNVVVGLDPAAGKGERVALKGEDLGLREYRAGKMELLPQTENIFLVYKDGWHNPESSPHNPSLERTWTKKDALVSFKNPKKDILVYLEADTNTKLVNQPQALTLSIGNVGLRQPVDNSEVFLKKVRFKKEDLGDAEWVDLKLGMNYSFVPKDKGLNQDPRELGLLVYHLYVGEEEKVGSAAGVEAATTLAPATRPAASPAKVAPVAKKS